MRTKVRAVIFTGWSDHRTHENSIGGMKIELSVLFSYI